MPTVHPSTHPPSPWKKSPRHTLATSPSHLLTTLTTPDGSSPLSPPHLIQSSFSQLSRTSTTYASRNSLVHTVLEAYNEHLNLVLRPDDIWLAILVQLSSYINAHAQDLRDRFVSHAGQMDLHIEVELAGLEHGKMAYEMTKLMGESLQDAWRDWLLPAFSTTDKTDQEVASVVMMGTMQKYFTYSWGTRCGIPSVTLLGEEEDWCEIAERCISRLGSGELGAEVKMWYRDCLRAVLEGFLETFRDPAGEEAKRFWRGVVDRRRPNGSGSESFGGWLMGFCYWDEKGRCLWGRDLTRGEIPMGFVKVPVTLVDQGTEVKTELVAGNVGMRVVRGEEGEEGEMVRQRWEGYDTVRPESGWFMYLV